MDVRVLGPFELVVAGEPVSLNGARQKALFARLALDAGRVVAADRLIDDLWGDRLPNRPASALQIIVARTRAGLAPRGDLIVTRAPGYLLDLRDDAVDVNRFEARLAEARRHEVNGRLADAVASLRAGLDQWRGPPLADLGRAVFADRAATRLEEMRWSAFETRVELDLRLGRSADLIAELGDAIADQPLRERLWAGLMLALYRAGRQADALGAYQRCRGQLIDELGIEPGPELQELEEAILLQRPELDWHPDAAERTVPVPPRRRPPPAPRTTFVGREADLDDLTDALTTHRLVTLVGPGGVGKTRLAVEAAAHLRDRFHHGVAFCDLVAVPTPDRVRAAVAEAVGAQDAPGPTERQDHDDLVDDLSNQELLVVIDNADQHVETVARLADRLLAGCPQVRVLVTCREPLRTAGELLHRLSPLDTSELDSPAAALFHDRARLVAPGQDLDHEMVAAVCRRLDGLPLAIELAASRLRSVPLDHLLAGLDDRLSAIDDEELVGSTPHGTLRGVVGWSIDVLPDEQRQLLRRLAVFAGGCTAEAAATVCGLERDLTEDLGALVERSLLQLQVTEDGTRYQLLETLRADGLVRLLEQGELDRYAQRHLQWCRRLVPAHEAPTHGEDPAALSNLDAEIGNVVAALSWGLAGGDIEGGARLSIAAAPWWVHAGRLREARVWLERAVNACPPSGITSLDAQRWLGWVLARQGDLGSARRVLADAVASHRTAADGGAVDATLLLATVELDSGELDAGETRLRDVVDLPAVRTSRHRQALVHLALGRRALMAGDLPNATERLEVAATAARQCGMWQSLVQVLVSIAQAESARNHPDRAQGAADDALAAARRHRLLGTMPSVLGMSALVAYRAGDWTLTRARLTEALAAARHVGDLHTELASLSNLGALAQNEGKPGEAVALLEQALELAERAYDDRTALLITTNLAEAVLAATSDASRALALATDALARARDAGIRVAAVYAAESAAFALLERDRPGNTELAANLLGAAAHEREVLDRPDDAGADSPLRRARARVEARLGRAPAAFDEGRREGLHRLAERLDAMVGSELPALTPD
jgi:predicted ATPase/DNA-binding SARP family transcriptional activator